MKIIENNKDKYQTVFSTPIASKKALQNIDDAKELKINITITVRLRKDISILDFFINGNSKPIAVTATIKA